MRSAAAAVCPGEMGGWEEVVGEASVCGCDGSGLNCGAVLEPALLLPVSPAE